MISVVPQLLALLQACKEDPANDEPRLVLADWLEEHDDSDRALLIRRQCGRTLVVDAPTQQELLQAPSPRWLGPLRPLPGTWMINHGLFEGY